MKKEDFVTTLVMTTVSVLMLVGVTIAWYTAAYATPAVTGMQLEAADMKEIKIALTQGGEDISVLQSNDDPDDEYVVVGLEKLINIEDGKMAPGAFGEVTFYITSLDPSITACKVVPMLVPEFEEGVTAEAMATIEPLLQSHIVFFTDAEMTSPLVEGTNDKIANLTWDEVNHKGNEIPVTLYWMWYYEYPFTEYTEDELQTLPEAEKEQKITQYDLEDTKIGTNVKDISFHFDFMIQ